MTCEVLCPNPGCEGTIPVHDELGMLGPCSECQCDQYDDDDTMWILTTADQKFEARRADAIWERLMEKIA